MNLQVERIYGKCYKCPERGNTGAAPALTASPTPKWVGAPVYTKKVKKPREVAIQGGCG